MALQFIITDAGRAAIAQVGGAIGPVTLTKIAIGSAGYTPTANRTALQSEIKRLDPSGSSVPVPGTIHMTTQDDSSDSYSVREIGLYTNNGDLFAIYSQTGVILTKGSTASALFALDFVMTNVPPGTVTVGDAGFSYAQANETRLGVLAIATTARTNDAKIVTPLKLAQVTATESRRGLIALATTAEAQALAPDATKALTVARLVDRTANTGRAGVVVLATNAETQAGTDAAKAVTPAALSSRAATTTLAGLVALATADEVTQGTNATKALTPANLKSALTAYAGAGHTHDASALVSGTLSNDRINKASTTVVGIVELADNTETQAGTDSSRAVTPAALAARTATDTRTGVVQLATIAETQAGTDAAKAVTPAALASAASLFVPPGAVLPFAMNIVPAGWLACNGQLVDRVVYAALFAAIGTTYGTTSSSNFAVPDLRGYFVRGSGTNADSTESGAFGSKQSDAFQAHEHTFRYPKRITAASPGSPISGVDVTFTSENTTAIVSSGTNGTPRIASETRPRNIALLYCIKF